MEKDLYLKEYEKHEEANAVPKLKIGECWKGVKVIGFIKNGIKEEFKTPLFDAIPDGWVLSNPNDRNADRVGCREINNQGRKFSDKYEYVSAYIVDNYVN